MTAAAWAYVACTLWLTFLFVATAFWVWWCSPGSADVVELTEENRRLRRKLAKATGHPSVRPLRAVGGDGATVHDLGRWTHQ